MEPIKNIQLSIICNENWDAMQPVSQGHHCDKCNLKVVDMADKSDTDLQVLKADNPSGLCGRFKLSQTIYHKAAAALIISSGIGLSAHAQVPQQRVAGKDKIQAKPEKLSTTKPIITEKKDTIPQYVVGAMYQPMPEYPGGEDGLMKFLKENIVYPPDLDKDGTVYVQYKIDTLGNVVEPKILRGLSPSADNEVLRVVKMLKYKPYKPAWGDGGTWNLPVKFIAPEKKDEK